MAVEAARQESEDLLHSYFRDVDRFCPLPAQEEVALASRIREGDLEARDRLVTANLKFVISVAKQYQNRGVPLSDVISAGNLGLITAAERFDGTKGVKFITYAVWWIRQAIQSALAEHRHLIRLPGNRADLLRRIARYVNSREHETTAPSSMAEMAEQLGVPQEAAVEVLSIGRRGLCLDAPLDGTGDRSLIDTIADNRQESPDRQAVHHALQEDVEAAVGALEPREREVIRFYFGLDGGDPMSLSEIGKRLGISRERVRQIKQKALRRLRYPARCLRLVQYLEDI